MGASEEESWASFVSAGVLTVRDIDLDKVAGKALAAVGVKEKECTTIARCLPAIEATASREQATRQKQLHHCFTRPRRARFRS
jgi:hypothetical protein